MFCNYNHHRGDFTMRVWMIRPCLIVKKWRNQTKLLTIVPGRSGTIGETVTVGVGVAVVGVIVGAAAVTGVHQGPVMIA